MSLVDEIQRNENMLSIKFETPLHVKKNQNRNYSVCFVLILIFLPKMTSAGKPISMKIYSRLKQPGNCVLVGKLLLFEHSSKLLKVVGLSSSLKACFHSYLPFFSPDF